MWSQRQLLDERLKAGAAAHAELQNQAIAAHMGRQQSAKSVSVKKEKISEQEKSARHKLALDGADE